MKMYKAPDYRCLKPKPGLPSSQWPHYDMEQYRAAKNITELNNVEEIPFDKESLVLQSISNTFEHLMFYFIFGIGLRRYCSIFTILKILKFGMKLQIK